MRRQAKDFGKGFYTTTDIRQAKDFARIVARRNKSDCAVLNTYELSNFDGLKVHEFLTADSEWLDCIVSNRNRQISALNSPWSEYDILIGKVADDNTSQVINAYLAGVFGEVGSEEAIKFTVSRFIPERLNNQICFKTEKSIERIRFLRSEAV